MKIIGLSAPVKSSSLRRMRDALGEVFDVRFEERMLENGHEIDAWFLYDADRNILHRIAFCEDPC